MKRLIYSLVILLMIVSRSYSQTQSNIKICDKSDPQYNSRGVSVDSTNMIIAWIEGQDSYKMYAQKLGTEGVPEWDSNGVLLFSMNGSLADLSIISDGQGGAFIAGWFAKLSNRVQHHYLYLQHISSSGQLLFEPTGKLVDQDSIRGSYDIHTPAIASDSAGGIFLAWHCMSGYTDMVISIHRLDSNGATLWDNDVRPILSDSGSHYCDV